MISIEQNFYAQFPRLAHGRSREWSRPVVDLLRRISCEARINTTLDAMGEAQGFAFIESALAQLRVHYRFAHSDRENIPTEGRVVIVANHPLGALDALALLHLVGSVRRDVRILANEVLMQLTPLHPLLLPTAVFGDKQGSAGLRGAYRALEREEALIVFPAGEVSRIRPTGVRDCDWSTGFLRFARRSGSPVLPVHIRAHNSPVFYGMSMLAKPLATLLLPREMLSSEPGRISLTVGDLVPSTALQKVGASDADLASTMRQHVYRLHKRRAPVFATSTAIAHPESPARVRRALQAAECLGQTSDGKQIRLLDADAENPALLEIGRLRELSYRRVGEGTGLRRDLDRFDSHYRHVVLWDDDLMEIVGAYRLGEASRILPQRGLDGLYSASLFNYSPAAGSFLLQAAELGRSSATGVAAASTRSGRGSALT
jgi:putative hemolysin